MISRSSLQARRAVERHAAAFLEDVAEQLRLAAERAGLAASITASEAEIALELDESGEGLRVVASFNDARVAMPGWVDWLTLSVETAEGRMTLLTLAWRDDEGLSEEERLNRRLREWESRVDRELPLDRRGLNAHADVREGRYARGSAVTALLRDMHSATGTAVRHEPRALALRAEPATVLRRERQPTNALPVIEVSAAAIAPGTPVANPVSAAAVSERLIAAVLEAMQQELANHEARFVSTGVIASAKARVNEAIEWAMVAIAYGIEAKMNQTAMASFIKGTGASWLYGLVGPVLIGGLASLCRTKTEKGTAFALMASWALAMATVTASDKAYLDGAQDWFPKGAIVLAREKALAAARQDQDGAEKELARLDGRSEGSTAALIVDAKKRWQARELAALEERGQKDRDAQRVVAAERARQAKDRVLSEEYALRQAVEFDASRQWAWRSLFLIFGVINFAGPFAISRVLEKWRRDHAAARKDAQDDHKLREAALALRHNRATQKARAMRLLPSALSALMQEGLTAGPLAEVDQVDVAEKAAERFDRSVNRQKYRRSLLRLLRPAAGS